MKNLLIGFSCLLLLIGCDSGGGFGFPDDMVEPLNSVRLTSVERVRLQSDHLLVIVSKFGSIGGIEWKDSAVPPATSKWPVSGAGLWLAVDQNGPKSNVSGLPGPNQFKFLQTESDTTGIIVVTPDSLRLNIMNWPSTAPTNPNGIPKIYGDRMAWASYQPKEPASTMINGIRLDESFYFYDSGPVSSVVFHRMDITNTSSVSLNDLYIGYGADIDVNAFGDFMGEPCRSLNHHSNQSGYDAGGPIAYTYISPFPEDGDLPDNCYGDVYAFAILPMTTLAGIGSDLLASRIVRRGGSISELYPDYSENYFNTPEVMLRALQGLSYLGDPMTDPTTGLPTRFAFTGDPVQGTGWLDERHDVRNLLSLQPVTVPPGETVTITVSWFFGSGNTLAEGMAQVHARYKMILENRESWDF